MAFILLSDLLCYNNNNAGTVGNTLGILHPSYTASVFNPNVTAGNSTSCAFLFRHDKLVLNVYKGTAPTPATLATNISTYSANLLISGQTQASMVYEGSAGFQAFRACTWTTPVNASASGVAAWFLVYDGFNNSAGDLSTNPCIYGTIGVPGTGTDCELDDVNINSGVGYRCNGIRFSLPQYFTW